MNMWKVLLREVRGGSAGMGCGLDRLQRSDGVERQICQESGATSCASQCEKKRRTAGWTILFP